MAWSQKIGVFQQMPHVKRNNVWHTTDIVFAPKIENKDETLNLREDIVPPEKITSIITEKGRIEPKKIWKHEDNEWISSILPEVAFKR